MMILRSDPSWLNSRVGMLTASNMWKALSFKKNGEPTEARDAYLREVVAERMTGFAVSHYISPAMQWGIDHQAEAISEFESETGMIVGPEAFFTHAEIADFGATPDGLIGNLDSDAFLEVKCPMTATHIRCCEEKKIPMDYRYQMAAQSLCADRAHGFFVSFDPRINKACRLQILEFTPSREFLSEVYSGAIKFLREAESLFSRVTEGHK